MQPGDPANERAPAASSPLERARRQLIAGRLPLFALAWLGAMGLWLVVFALESHLTRQAVVIVTLQAALLLAAIAICRADPRAARVLTVTGAACVLLGVSSTALFASVGGHGEILAFVLLTLCLATALLFGWGWRAEIVLVASMLVAWGLTLPAFTFFVPPLELAAALMLGCFLSVAVAEGAARGFRHAWFYRASNDEMTRVLAESRDAYRDLAETARDLIWAADLDGRLTYVNDAAAGYLGPSPQEIVGQSIAEHLTDDPKNPDVAAVIARVVAGETMPPILAQGRTPQGPRWFEVLVSAVHDPDGTVVGLRGISRDVTERRRAEERLRESEERFRAAFDDAAIGMAVLGIDGRPLQVNPALCAMLGYEAQDLLTKTVADVTHPDDVAQDVEYARALLAGASRSVQIEKRYLHKDGHVVWGLLAASLVRNAAGQPLYVISQVQDITERKQAADALRASEARYRGLIESAQELVARLDLEGRVTFANDSFCRSTGYTHEQILGQTFLHLIHDEDRAQVLGAIQSMTVPPYRTRIENRGLTPDGWRWFEWEGSAVRDANGRIVEIQSVGRDVTLRKQAEADLRESEERFRSAFDDASIGMAVAAPTGQGLRVNQAFRDMLGYSEEEMLAGRVQDITHPDDLEATIIAASRVLSGEARSYQLEKRYLHKDGHVVWVWVSSSLVRDPSGTPLYFIAQMQDTTARKLGEEALRASLEDLRRSGETLRLLAQRQVMIREEERKRLGFDLHDDVCQELVGVGILVASLRRRMSPMAGEHAGEFDRIVHYLGEVVEHLRVLARELRPMLLHDLGLDGSLRSLADGMSAATRVVTDFRTPIPRLTEETELTVYRIAQEALANAARHAGARSIVVSLAATDGLLRLEVQDDGCGFDPAAPRTEALGLVSMEERALALGGRLELSSAPGKGTTVRLQCPLVARAPASAA
jgi:PAS domain S-box-containing protein